jgi:hypothetical protein
MIKKLGGGVKKEKLVAKTMPQDITLRKYLFGLNQTTKEIKKLQF